MKAYALKQPHQSSWGVAKHDLNALYGSDIDKHDKVMEKFWKNLKMRSGAKSKHADRSKKLPAVPKDFEEEKVSLALQTTNHGCSLLDESTLNLPSIIELASSMNWSSIDSQIDKISAFAELRKSPEKQFQAPKLAQRPS